VCIERRERQGECATEQEVREWDGKERRIFSLPSLLPNPFPFISFVLWLGEAGFFLVQKQLCK
jgi:hypothetical protein